MTANSKLNYKIYEDRQSGQWHWEVATDQGQVIERGSARGAIEARSEAVRRALARIQDFDKGSKHKSEGHSGAASPA